MLMARSYIVSSLAGARRIDDAMCRLFGFRSVIPSQIHRSLLDADNALGQKSAEHPDGWGVAYYAEGVPHLMRSPKKALNDQLFHRLSGLVSSETVVAHVRKATEGEISVLNCHPFQYGPFTFAHNGDIPQFKKIKSRLLREVAPRLRRMIFGETDSELLFYLLLSRLIETGSLKSPLGAEALADALEHTDARVREISETPGERAKLTMLVSDGTNMLASQGGPKLYYSTFKERCSDRETCPHLGPECEAPSATGFVKHLLISSEPIRGENQWTALGEGEIIGVDGAMRILGRKMAHHQTMRLAVL